MLVARPDFMPPKSAAPFPVWCVIMIPSFWQRLPSASVCLAVAALLTWSGCSQGPEVYPVKGRVEFEDGQPLTTGGSVFFDPLDEGKQATEANARGAIRDDGTFVMGTYADDDGVYPGKHRVLVKAMRDPSKTFADSIVPLPVIHPRCESYETSGVEAEVKAGDNEIVIQVAPPDGV